MNQQNARPRVAVAGASGFVGRHLLERLVDNYDLIALSRTPRQSLDSRIEWRSCDLFSAGSTRKSLAGAEIAIYLVHSMQPSTRLFQGSFEDTDLLLADNFARACAYHGVKQLIYLSGLWPQEAPSPHLLSRHEVEKVFQAASSHATILRAGMVVGPGGSSFDILRRLVERLPAMILPAWTENQTQAVALEDLLRVIDKAIEHHAFYDRVINVVNGERLDYRQMLQLMARVLNKKVYMGSVPVNWSHFSKSWVSWISGASKELVSPLIDSLKCQLPHEQPEDLIADCIQLRSFADMAQHSLSAEPAKLRATRLTPSDEEKEPRNTVRSIQRLPALRAYNAPWIAEFYMSWLQDFFMGMIQTQTESQGDRIRFRVPILNWTLLELQYIAGYFDDERRKFYVVGGLLCKRCDTGWLEFRQIANKRYTLAALHEFVPRLPWLFYLLTQAQAHAFVMWAFGRALQQYEDRWRASQSASPYV